MQTEQTNSKLNQNNNNVDYRRAPKKHYNTRPVYIIPRRKIWRDIKKDGKFKGIDENIISKILRRTLYLESIDFIENEGIKTFGYGVLSIYIKQIENNVVNTNKFGRIKMCVDWNKTYDRWNKVGNDGKRIYKNDKYIYKIKANKDNITAKNALMYTYLPSETLFRELLKRINDKKIMYYV